jgi:hypothetical protein
MIPIILMDLVIAFSTIHLLGSEQTGKRVYIRRIYVSAGIAMTALIILHVFL